MVSAIASRRPPAPSRPRSSTSRFAPARFEASWARRSARRWAGWRIWETSSWIASSSSLRGGITTPSSSSVVESAGIEPGVGPPTSAWWARLAAKPSRSPPSSTGVMTVMSGRCVPPANGSLSTHGVPSAWFSSLTAATASGIAPRWTGMCSACMTIWASASNSAQEASRRSLMFALWDAFTSTAPISSQAARSAPETTRSVIGSTGTLLQPDRAGLEHLARPAGRNGERGLGQLDQGRALDLRARRGLAGQHRGLVLLADEDRRARGRLRAGRGRARRGGVHVGSGLRRGRAQRDELDLALGVAEAVGLLVGGVEGLAQLARVPVRLDGQLEGLAAVAQLGGQAHVGLRVAELLARPLGQRGGLAPQGVVREIVAPQQHAALDVAAALGDDEAERRQHARGARAEDPGHPELLRNVGGVQAAGAAEAQQRQLARVDAALDGHHAQRADHLGVGDAADPLGALERLEAERVRELGDRGSCGVAVER